MKHAWFSALGLLILGWTGVGVAAAAPLPRVLILGDSISIGYTPLVRAALAGVAEVVRPMTGEERAENCEGTTQGVQAIERWLALGGGNWDVIHFNFGLHDLKAIDPASGAASNDPEHPRQADLAGYAAQLRRIVAALKRSEARLIFATTTPVPEGGVRPHRAVADVARYNGAAEAIMREQEVAVNDLYSLVLTRLEELQLPRNVHFRPAGSQVLADEVTRQIRNVLGNPVGAPAVSRGARRPNVVVMMADDQGTIDANCYGAEELLTPGIDELARRGLRFSQFYAGAPVCSPSRAAMLTRRYPVRAGMPGNASSTPGHAGMPASEVTVAETFKAAGYVTAHVGKWHLGYEPATMPNAQGFDFSFGHMGGCIDMSAEQGFDELEVGGQSDLGVGQRAFHEADRLLD